MDPRDDIRMEGILNWIEAVGKMSYLTFFSSFRENSLALALTHWPTLTAEIILLYFENCIFGSAVTPHDNYKMAPGDTMNSA